MKESTKKIAKLLAITVPEYDEDNNLYVISKEIDNPNLGLLIKKIPFRDQHYAKKQYDFINSLDKLNLSEDIIMTVKEIEEIDNQINLMANIVKDIRINLRTYLNKEIGKGVENENQG